MHLLVECGKVNVRLLHVRTLYSCASERVKLAVLQVGRWIMLPIPGRLVRNRMMLCGADVMHVRLPPGKVFSCVLCPC